MLILFFTMYPTVDATLPGYAFWLAILQQEGRQLLTFVFAGGEVDANRYAAHYFGGLSWSLLKVPAIPSWFDVPCGTPNPGTNRFAGVAVGDNGQPLVILNYKQVDLTMDEIKSSVAWKLGAKSIRSWVVRPIVCSYETLEDVYRKANKQNEKALLEAATEYHDTLLDISRLEARHKTFLAQIAILQAECQKLTEQIQKIQESNAKAEESFGTTAQPFPEAPDALRIIKDEDPNVRATMWTQLLPPCYL